MKNGVTIWRLADVIESAAANSTQLPSGRWVPARPLGWTSLSMRWKAAWLVFTGKADALMWEGQ